MKREGESQGPKGAEVTGERLGECSGLFGLCEHVLI